MTFQGVLAKCYQWLTQPVSPYPLALFRILFGIILLLNGLFLYPDLDTWFSSNGIFSLELARKVTGSNRLNVFLWFGDSPQVVAMVFWSYMLAGFGLVIGLAPRAMALVVFVCIASFSHRNIFILHSGDTFLRVISFLMIFAPSAAALSLQSWLAGGPKKSINAEAYRLIQFQVCLVYLATFVFKTQGNQWMDGSAVYVVQQLTEFERFSLPEFMRTPFMSKVLTWGTLAIEGFFPIGVWFRDTRLPILGAMIAMHLGIEYSMNVQLFEWTMITTVVLFLSEREIGKLLRLRDLQEA